MKTLILNGSPKKDGDTAALIAQLTAHLQGEVRVVSAHFDNISPCTDCRFCWQNPGCAVDDAMQDVYAYLEGCDNVVIASPIWFSELSGPLLNLASRLQTYCAARLFRGEAVPIKHKNSVLLLAGAEPGTEKKAVGTARTIFKHLNALPCTASVFSLRTDQTPAAEDAAALAEVRAVAALLNRLYYESENN